MATVEEFLEHHGIKGMKWGVRRDPRTGVRPIAKTLDESKFGRFANRNAQRSMTRSDKRHAKRLVRRDKKWQKNIYTLDSAIKIHNRVADKMNNGGIEAFNKKHTKPGVNYLDPTNPESHRYMAEFEKLSLKYTAEAVNEIHGTSPSGGYRAVLDVSDPAEPKIVIKPNEVKHANQEFPTLTIEAVVEDGKIVALKNVKAEAEHSSMDVEDFLEHYGVKGMKWGIRNDRSRVKKGRSRPPSSDARKIAELKKKKPHQLTNKQLKAVQERANLERSFRQANPAKVEKGHAFAKSILAIGSTAASFYALSQSPAGKALIKIGKGFINVNFSARPAGTTKIDLNRYRYSAQGKLF